jgi:hypothetical protein
VLFVERIHHPLQSRFAPSARLRGNTGGRVGEPQTHQPRQAKYLAGLKFIWSTRPGSNRRPPRWQENTNPRNHHHLRSSDRHIAAQSGISRHLGRQSTPETAPRRHQIWAHGRTPLPHRGWDSSATYAEKTKRRIPEALLYRLLAPEARCFPQSCEKSHRVWFNTGGGSEPLLAEAIQCLHLITGIDARVGPSSACLS